MTAATFVFPAEVEGWLSPKEGEMLGSYAEQCRKWIVELGSYKGRATICLAQFRARVLTVDHFEGSTKDKIDGGYEAALKANLDAAGVSERVTIVKRDTVKAATYFNRSVELLFIDGDHERAGNDMAAWLRLCTRWIAFHDSTIPQVEAAIETLKEAHGWEVCDQVDQLTVLECPS